MDKQLGKAGKVTYGQLSEALTTIGFVRRQTENFIAFREAKRGALILLPNMDDNSLVGDPHMVTVRNTVTGKGVATTEQFNSLLHARQTTRMLPSNTGAIRNGLKGRIKSRGIKRRLLMPVSQRTE